MFNYQGTSGRGVKHVIYWKPGNDQTAKSTHKVSLTLYENDVVQVRVMIYLKNCLMRSKVSGSSFILWTMDHFSSMVSMANTLLSEVSFEEQIVNLLNFL